MPYLTEGDYSAQGGPLRFPDSGADDNCYFDYRNRFFNRLATYRNRHMERMALDLWYHLGRQWIELDIDVIADGIRGYVFRDIRRTAELSTPRPVTNLIRPSVEIEQSALGKRELTPKIIANATDPKTEAAARVATDLLNHRLRTLKWPDIREDVIFQTIVTGTGALVSYWDETWQDTKQTIKPAFRCTATGELFAHDTIPRSQIDQVTANRSFLQDNPEDPDNLSIGRASPLAEGGSLEPYTPTVEEAQGEDIFGRPLGEEVPKGNTMIEVVSPFDLFIANSGIGITPGNCPIWGRAVIRSLDWIQERYPDVVDEIQPDSPSELMRWHPILGDWTYLGNYNSTLDSNIYSDHAMVYEVAVEPNARFPAGQYLVMAGEKVLEVGPLYVQVDKGARVPKVKFAACRYVSRAGEFWGQSLVDFLISPQNRINGMDAQIIESRERLGSPHILLREGLNMKGPFFVEEWGVGKFIYYEPDPMAPQYEPQIFGNEGMNAVVYEERDRLLADMKTIAGPQDVEIGEAPRNITTTSGLQILGEQSDRRRSSRERSLISMYETIWQHQLELLWAFRTEGDTDTYEVETAHGGWEERQFDGTMIAGQTKVKIEKQSYIDRSLYQKEAAREAQADKLYRLDSFLAVKRLLELRGLPTDVNENLNYQVDDARRQWVDFKDNSVIPVIDKTIDDPLIHFEALSTLLM